MAFNLPSHRNARTQRLPGLVTVPGRAALAVFAFMCVLVALPARADEGVPAARQGAHDQAAPRLIAYFTQWGIYDANFLVKDVAASGAAAKLTHINYAFGNVAPDPTLSGAPVTCQSGDPWADYEKPWTAAQSVDGIEVTAAQPLRGNFQQLRQLKLLNPSLKLLVSLGGWTWSAHFSNAALTEASRRVLAKSCVDLFIKGLLPQDAPGDTGSAVDVFDGIDIDWEYPGQCGNSCEPGVARPEDTRNFTLLLQEFRRQLDEAARQRRRPFLLTIAAAAGPATLAKLELAQIARSLDFINVMTYDYHGAWEGSANFNSPLFPSSRDPSRAQRLSTAETVGAYLAGGVPRHKLVIGVPAYSQGWQGVADVNHGLYQPGTGNPTLIYRQAKALRDAGEFVRFADPLTAGAWLYNPGTQVFWTYDDAAVMQAKACFARALGLGGVMMWELGGDTADAELSSALHATLRARHPGLACAAALPAWDPSFLFADEPPWSTMKGTR